MLLTVASANSLGKPKGTLRQPRSLNMPEEGSSKRPVPRLPRGREVACGGGKPVVESPRSALPSAAGSGPPKEIPMQRHVTVVNRSVCVCVHKGKMKCDRPLDAAMQAVSFGIQWESRPLPLQQVKSEYGMVPRKETDDILPFWVLP